MRPRCRRHHRRRRWIGLGRLLERAPWTGEGGLGGHVGSQISRACECRRPPTPPPQLRLSHVGGTHAVTTRSGGPGALASSEVWPWSRLEAAGRPTGPRKHSALDVTELARSGWSMVDTERERAGVMARRSHCIARGTWRPRVAGWQEVAAAAPAARPLDRGMWRTDRRRQLRELDAGMADEMPT